MQKDARAVGATRLDIGGDIDDTVDAFITDDIAMGDEGGKERDWTDFPFLGPGRGRNTYI